MQARFSGVILQESLARLPGGVKAVQWSSRRLARLLGGRALGGNLLPYLLGMIERLDLKFGPGPGRPLSPFLPGAMTVFVGPNNGGKSILPEDINLLFSYVAQIQGLSCDWWSPSAATIDSTERHHTPLWHSRRRIRRFSSATTWNTDDIFLGSLLEDNQHPQGMSQQAISGWQEQRDPQTRYQAEATARRMLVLKLTPTKDRLHLYGDVPAGSFPAGTKKCFSGSFSVGVARDFV